MKVIRLLLGLMAVSFVSLAFAKVTVDFDKNVDFSKYKTYAWQKGTPARDPLMQQRIVDAIEDQLAAEGVTKTSGTPDLYVVTHASTKKEQRVHVDDFGYAGHRWNGWGAWGPTTVNVYDVSTGTLLVDFLDGESKKLVWRSVVTRTLSDNPQKMAKYIKKAVKKMFKKFPPKK